MEKLLVIDGNSLANRAFYALPLLTNEAGEYSNAVYGFVNILVKFISEQKPTHIAVAFDAAKKTFRNEIYAEYKGTRKGMPDELRSQMPILKQVLESMGIKLYEQVGIEADDIIGTIAKLTKNIPTIILSGDRDVLQLVDDSTEVWLTKKGISEVQKIDTVTILDEFGITPPQVIELKSLMGDASDNIPGVMGVGEKTAKSLIEEYKTLDGVYENIDNIKGKLQEKLITSKDNAYLSHTLATIKTDCSFGFDINDCTYNFPFTQETKNYFVKYDFKSLLKRQEIFVGGVSLIDETLSKELEMKKPKKNLVEINNIEQLRKIVDSEEKDYFAFNFLSDFDFAFNDKVCYHISNQLDLFGGAFIDLSEILNIIEPILKDKNIAKITFDLKSHLHLNDKFLSCKENVFDIMIASYLVLAGDKNTNKLEIFEYDYQKQLLIDELKKLKLIELYNKIEMPLCFVLYDMEKCGFSVDGESLEELSVKYTNELKSLTSQIYELAGQEFNINSPKQLATILFDVLNIQTLQNKKRSTGIDILNEIECTHEIVPLIIRYRKIQKLNSTYVEVYKNLVQKNGNIIYTLFNQTLTSTGRLSSSEPNLQNIPIRDDEGKLLRKIFVSRFDNGMIISADYNQIELRLLANFSKDKDLINAYKSGNDIHRATASQIFNKPIEEVTSHERSSAKAVNFGIVYGISSYGLSQQIGTSQKQAKQFIEKYLETYPQVSVYMKENVDSAKRLGYAITLFGRIRKINELFSANRNIQQFGERVAMNMPLQGSASDIIKIAMIKVQNAFKEKKLKSKLILQIHDELIVDACEEEIEIVKTVLKDCMESVVDLTVPLIVSIESGKTWFDAK